MPPSKQERRNGSPSGRRRKRVLLVEDHPLMRSAVVSLLLWLAYLAVHRK